MPGGWLLRMAPHFPRRARPTVAGGEEDGPAARGQLPAGSMWRSHMCPVEAMTTDQVRSLPPAQPVGRVVPLATGGRTWAWEMAGPPGAPVVVLLHGWMATAALNWYGSLSYLGRSFRVIAPDLRGHGRLGRGAPPFSVDGCADDIASIEDELGVARAVVVGYSMGGAIAQVFARRHRERAEGMVLCATAASFARRLKLRPTVRVAGKLGAASVRRWPDAGQRFLAWRIARHDQASLQRRARGRGAGTEHGLAGRAAGEGAAPTASPAHPDWALRERTMADLAAFIEAGAALNAYDSSAWLPHLDVPAAVLVTQRDKIVAPWRQEAMATLIPGSKRYLVDAGHDAVVSSPDAFLPALWTACAGLLLA